MDNNMKHTLHLITLAIVAVLMGCTDSKDGKTKNMLQPTDTIYTQEAAMAVYDYDPVRALQIIDSAVIVGNLSDWQADMNRARIYSQTRLKERLDSLMHWPAGARLDTARAIGERLLRHDSVKNSLEEQQDVLEILAYAARRIVTVLNDYEQHPDRYHDGTYREPTADRRQDYIRFYRTQAENFIATAYADLGKTGDMQATFERLENIINDAEAREHQARYRALEQKMAADRERMEMEAQAQRNLYFAVIVCILLAVALAALAWYFWQMRIVKQKNRYLVQYIEKTLPQPLPVRERVGESLEHLPEEDSALFAQIHDTIIRESLYLSPNCDRQMLTDRFGLSKERLGSLFVQYSDAKNVAGFINGLRLVHAAQLLTTQPDMDIREVATASGFGSHQYFSTCFKQRFGLSPTDYRAAKGL